MARGGVRLAAASSALAPSPQRGGERLSHLCGAAKDHADGYLHKCEEMGLGTGDLAQIEIVGNATLADCARPFRPRDTYQSQQRWMLPRAEEFLT